MINFLSIFRNFNFSLCWGTEGCWPVQCVQWTGAGLIIENLSQALRQAVTLGGETADKINYSGEEPLLYLSCEFISNWQINLNLATNETFIWHNTHCLHQKVYKIHLGRNFKETGRDKTLSLTLNSEVAGYLSLSDTMMMQWCVNGPIKFC